MVSTNELLFSNLCNNIGHSKAKPTWKETLVHAHAFGVWDDNVAIPGEYRVSRDKKSIIKLRGKSYTDCDIVLFGKPIANMDIYAEFVYLSKGSEGYIGVTTNPEAISKITGSPIIMHQETWAYTCGARHNIQLGGVAENGAERYDDGDYIGVLLETSDIECPKISFFKNRTMQHQQPFNLPVGKAFTFFAILDSDMDILTSSYWCYGKPVTDYAPKPLESVEAVMRKFDITPNVQI